VSYLKLPLTTQDHCVGYQSVVQAINNNGALVDAFDAKHSIGVGGESPYGQPTKAIGRHDDILIARSVADFDVDTTLPIPALSTIVTGPVLVGLGGLNYTRLGTGQWQIFLATPQLYAAVALMKSTASSDRKATCYRATSLTQGPSVIVSTWNVATPALADLPFSLIVWTQAA
jgi:hypothetical protein